MHKRNYFCRKCIHVTSYQHFSSKCNFILRFLLLHKICIACYSGMNFISYLADEEVRFFLPLHKYRNAGIQLNRIEEKTTSKYKSFIESEGIECDFFIFSSIFRLCIIYAVVRCYILFVFHSVGADNSIYILS